MGDIVVTMSRAAYEHYLSKNGGRLRSKEELVKYLNSLHTYRGNVVDVHVDENIERNPFVKEE